MAVYYLGDIPGKMHQAMQHYSKLLLHMLCNEILKPTPRKPA